MAEPRIIRPSSLSRFSDCPRRHAARHFAALVVGAGYALRSDMPRHIGAAVGTAVHAGAMWTLATIQETGEPGSSQEAEDRAIEALRAEAEVGVSWDDTSPRMPDAQRQAAKMVRSYRRHLAPQLQPVLVEKRLQAEVAEGWIISGQPDTVMADNPDNSIRDLKTGKQRSAGGQQYGGYQILVSAHGYRPVKLYEDFLRRVRIDADQPPPVTIEYPMQPSVDEAWATIDAIRSAVAEFERRAAGTSSGPPPQAFPANPSSALCGPRFCPAHGTKFCRIHS